jgi:gamma-glutamyltranspeptidase/glutathione hydrolase
MMLETPVFSKAAVAAPHHLAAETGRAILAEGGNALEAMLGMAATIAVVYPHMNSIGGDGFWLIREPSGKVFYIEACGYAGSRATIERYRRDLDLDIIPRRGSLSAVTIPGTVGGWILAHEMAKSLGGTLPLADLLRDSIRFAREGYPQSASAARSVPREFDDLKEAPGFAETYFVEGKFPAAGTPRQFRKLADTLDHMSHAGLDDFYRGDIAREMASDMERIGAAGTREDLARFRAVLREPLSLRLAGRQHFNSPPPTQGLASLIILGLFEQLKIKKAESFEHIHGLVEASKRALAIRDAVCTDFERLKHDPSAFLTPQALQREAQMIRMDRAASLPIAPAAGDTIWMGAIDAQGRAVSFIQSVYWEFGSGCVLPGTGVLLQNRGISFSLDKKDVNPLAPGRRPFHTLNPPLVAFEDGKLMSYGSMGGDGQPQFQAQVLTRYLLGQTLADALDAPRFLFGKTWGDASTSLKLEPRFDDGLVRALGSVGHEIEVAPQPYMDGFGHAGGLIRHKDGHIEAAHDPRSDGGAAGL